MKISDFNHIMLSAETIIKPFKCIDEDLNGFLFEDAKDYLRSKMAVTYLFEDETDNRTVAYYSLLNDKIIFNPEIKSFWNKINRKIANSKRRKDYPAVKIGRLAISEEYANQGLGKGIISILKYQFSCESRTGCRFLTVDAYSDAVDFYKKCGFDFVSERDSNDKTRAMYYDLKSFIIS